MAGQVQLECHTFSIDCKMFLSILLRSALLYYQIQHAEHIGY